MSEWIIDEPDLLLATAHHIRDAGALKVSFLGQMREWEERVKYEKGQPNNYEEIREVNGKIRGREYHFEIVEQGQEPNTPWRHTRLVWD